MAQPTTGAFEGSPVTTSGPPLLRRYHTCPPVHARCHDLTSMCLFCRRMYYWLQCRIDRSAEELSLLCNEMSAAYLQYQKRLAAYTDWLEATAPVKAQVTSWTITAAERVSVRIPSLCVVCLTCVVSSCGPYVVVRCCACHEREPVAIEHRSRALPNACLRAEYPGRSLRGPFR